MKSAIGRRGFTIGLAAILLWLPPLAFYAVFFLNPLSATFILAFQSFTEAAIWREMLLRAWPPFLFTAWQAVLSTAITMAVGLPAAYLFARYRFPGKRLLRVVTTLPFILPTVVVAASFNALLGPNGWLNSFLMQAFDLDNPPIQLMNTLAMILIAHVFYNTTIVIRVVGSAWAQMDDRIEQAARTLGANPFRAFTEVTFPLLRPSILSAMLLVFLFDFTSFGVILLLGGPAYATLEVEIYIQTLQYLNLKLAGVLSVIQMIVTLLVMWLSLKIGGRQTSFLPRLKGETQRQPRTWFERATIAFIIFNLVVLLLSPLVALIARAFFRFDTSSGNWIFTLQYFSELFVNRRGSIFYVPPIDSAINSLKYALITVALSLGFGIPAAYGLSKRKWYTRFIDPLIMLPMGTSAVTLGLGFILVFNKPPLDVRTFPLLVPIAHSLVALPFVIRTLQPAIDAIPESLHQAARVLGARSWQVWTEIDLPILLRAVVVASVFAFTISLGEFGATSFISRPEFPTLPVAIYRFLSRPGAMNYGQAMAIATILMVLCALAILVLERFSEQGEEAE